MPLYCTGSYAQYPMQIPGIGIVLQTDNEWIKHRWIVFEIPSKEKIDNSFESVDAEKFTNVRFSSHWLFEISKLSFSKIVGSQLVDWGEF